MSRYNSPYYIEPDGAVERLMLPGEGEGRLVTFFDPMLVNPSFVRYEKASPKLQEFILRRR